MGTHCVPTLCWDLELRDRLAVRCRKHWCPGGNGARPTSRTFTEARAQDGGRGYGGVEHDGSLQASMWVRRSRLEGGLAEDFGPPAPSASRRKSRLLVTACVSHHPLSGTPERSHNLMVPPPPALVDSLRCFGYGGYTGPQDGPQMWGSTTPCWTCWDKAGSFPSWGPRASCT